MGAGHNVAVSLSVVEASMDVRDFASELLQALATVEAIEKLLCGQKALWSADELT